MTTLFRKNNRKRKVNEKYKAPSTIANTLHGQKKDQEESFEFVPKKNYDSFAEMGLSNPLQCSCANLGFKRPTRIQEEVIPYILEGKSILALSPTGSGKTASYVLPILEKLSHDPYGIFAIIVTPTRELAKQVHEQVLALGSILKVRSLLVIGGGDIVRQTCELSRFPHFVCATPGRFAYLLRTCPTENPIPIQKIRFLVLDEADQLIKSGFERDVAEIILSSKKKANNNNSQTLIFSATMTCSLEKISMIASGGDNPTSFKKIIINNNKTDKESTTIISKFPVGLSQEYIFIPSHVRETYLITVLRTLVSGAFKPPPQKKQRRVQQTVVEEEKVSKIRSVLIFCSSCERTAHLFALMQELGIKSLPLYSLLSQSNRFASLAQFKSEQVPILIATDIASRGLDIPTVDLVINYELPLRVIDYIHRVGRTARAGRRGRAISLVAETDVKLVHSIENATNTVLKKCDHISDKDAIGYLNVVSKASRVAKMKLAEKGFDELLKKHKTRKKQEKNARSKIKALVTKQLLEKQNQK